MACCDGGFVAENEMKPHYLNDCVVLLKAWADENGIWEIVYRAIRHICHRQPAAEILCSLFCNKAQKEGFGERTVVYQT